MAQRTCPKCQSSMQEGWVLDQTHGARAIASWVEGEPQKSIWVGVKLEGKQAQQMVKLMDALDEHDDVRHVWSNFDIEEKEIEASLA